MLEDYKSGIQLMALTLSRHQIPPQELRPVLLKHLGLKHLSAAGAVFQWSEQKQTSMRAKHTPTRQISYYQATELFVVCQDFLDSRKGSQWHYMLLLMQGAASIWDADSRLSGSSENPSCNFLRSKRKPGSFLERGVIPLGRAVLFPELFLTPGRHCWALTSCPELVLSE